MTARDEILARINAALGGGAASGAAGAAPGGGAAGAAPGVGGAAPGVPRAYNAAGSGPAAGDEGVVARFCERAAEYRATVRRVDPAELEDAIAAACREHGARRIAVPAGCPWRPPGVELVFDDPPISPRSLDRLDGVLSGCALAIAETGTVVLDGGAASGRRALTLVPDLHVCVVEAGAVHASVPDAIAALAPAAAEGRPITFVSGPSATSDIELERVEGVHGPRELVILVNGRS